jgi:hypothetical protein
MATKIFTFPDTAHAEAFRKHHARDFHTVVAGNSAAISGLSARDLKQLAFDEAKFGGKEKGGN